MLNNNFEVPVEEMELEIAETILEPATNEEAIIQQGEDYKKKAIATYKNAISHEEVLIADLTGQLSNPDISEELRVDWETQLKMAKARKNEIEVSISVLEGSDK